MMMGMGIESNAAPSRVREGRKAATAVLWFISFLTVAAPAARGQLPSVQPVPAWKQVPSGEGACSVEKSCAELAPELIRSALGDSPLAENVNTLARMIGTRVDGSPSTARAVNWAVEAFRRAGADEVHTESAMLPGQRNSGLGAAAQNVVAEIRGHEKSNEFILIGASLDSRATAEASYASACAVATLIDAVRVIHSSGSIPRRTIRFVLFTKTSQGIDGGQAYRGGQAYVRTHRAALDGLIAAVFFEPGNGAIRGYSLDGRGDALAAVRKTLEPAASLGIKELTVDAAMGENNLDFLLEGVPTLVTRQDAGSEVHSGPLEAAVITELKRHAAIAAVTAYALADGDGRIAARQSRREIEQLLKNTGLDQQMKAANIWALWESGERGRQR
jgi:hypothetical protein